MKPYLPFTAVLVVLALGACSQKPTAPAAVAAAAPKALASVQEIMLEGIDPAADVVWGSVSSVYNETGLHEHAPKTDADWHAVRSSAMMLVERPNLLAMEGRHVASPVPLPEQDAEVKPAEVEARIAANRPGFTAMAQGLQAVGVKIVAAVDSRDTAALMELGGELDEACEACHTAFWYPEEAAAKTAADASAQQKN